MSGRPASGGGAGAAWPLAVLLVIAGCGRGPTAAGPPPGEPTPGDSRTEADRPATSAAPPPADVRSRQTAAIAAGERAVAAGDLDGALERYVAAADIDRSTDEGSLALYTAGETCMALGRLSRAEEAYRGVLAVRPDNLVTHERLAFLTALTGRRWEALRHYFALVRSGSATHRELALAADVNRPLEQPDFLARCLTQQPDDPNVRAAAAAEAFSEGRAEARPLLERLVADFPGRVAAQAMLGELLAADPDPAAFARWHGRLPAGADDSPEVWMARGLWCRARGRPGLAADCFRRSARLAPLNRRAYYLLGQTLAAAGDPLAEEAVAYSGLQIELSQAIDQVLRSDGRDAESVRRTAGLMERLGRVWEAVAWAVVGRRSQPGAAWHADLLGRLAPRLGPDLPEVLADRLPQSVRRGGEADGFESLVAAALAGPGGGGPGGEAPPLRFEARPLDFAYFSADDPETPGVRMFEQTGGGVAVLDYDLDGAPDLFLPQGAEWPTGSDEPRPTGELRDALLRNRGGRLEDASAEVGGEDLGYGQGAAAADLNQDGFADLAVANVGANRLLLNLGDGTFADATTPEMAGAAWTASLAACDLDGDSLPDLYEVNYLRGDRVYSLVCAEIGCSPGAFEGSPNRLLRSLGDGRFEASGDGAPDGDSKGLGVVAFGPPGAPPRLFVANDQTANFLLAPEPSAGGVRLVEEALVGGLAFNDDGTAMACMGVACDDWDRDGRPDLFVTNFLDEANTLYRQDSAGLFVDATRPAGLSAPSLEMTGWGAQSLDADLDGWPDLALLNGHVYPDKGAYKMRPQAFRNLGGRFEEAAPPEGSWLAEPRLGRGLARLDFDLDGRPDLAASYLDGPALLIRNATETAGGFLKVRLRAAGSDRDAVGAEVVLCSEGPDGAAREDVGRVTAGDGYMATNERTVFFGLGDRRPRRLTVRWPSGAATVVEGPAAGRTITLVEGAARGTAWDGRETARVSARPLADAPADACGAGT